MSKLNLSFSERIGMGIGFILGFTWVAISVLAVPFQRSKGPVSLKRHLKLIFFRVFPCYFSPQALVTLSPSTDESYRKVLKEECLEPESITLDDGTHVHLLGDDSAEKVLLFFHGGGYVTPAVDAHFKLLVETIHQVEEHGGRLKIFFLQYDLAVVSPYPRQLQQASALLKYTLTTLGKQPEQVLLAGDSAGGHLALALLSHILHPHPTVHPIKLDGRFSSVALLSPWVTFDTGKTRSMRLNRYKDALAIPTLNAWSSTFIGNAPLDPYLQPLKAPENWFQGLPVQRVLVLAGGDEIFVDDIREFGESLRHTFPPTIVEIVKDEAHDHLILAFLMGEQSSKQQTIFQDWILQSVDQ